MRFCYDLKIPMIKYLLHYIIIQLEKYVISLNLMFSENLTVMEITKDLH